MTYDKKYFSNLEKGEAIEYPRNLRILKELEKYSKKGKVLDIGVGSGLFLKLAKKNSWDVFGSDVSEYAIDRLKKDYPKKLKVGKLNKATYPKDFFDAVNLRHTIEHLDNPEETLKIIFSILKPGGVIAIATPNSYGLHALVLGKDWPHWSLPYHLHFFSKTSLKELVEKCGFKVLTLKTEELTSYDFLKLILFKLKLKKGFNNPSKLSILINNSLVKIDQGEGLFLIAKKV